MKINGFGEFESLRKAAMNKKETRKRDSSAELPNASRAASSDAVQISPKARLFSQLSQIPDVREEKIADLRAKMDAGTLVTPEALRDGIKNMLETL